MPVRDAVVEVMMLKGGVIEQSRTRHDGSYSIAVAPGRYRLVVDTGSMLPRCPARVVSVESDSPTRANVDCDTGIR
jgi:hypothetical protein